MEAKEIMSKDVVAVAPEMLVTEAADLLCATASTGPRLSTKPIRWSAW